MSLCLFCEFVSVKVKHEWASTLLWAGSDVWIPTCTTWGRPRGTLAQTSLRSPAVVAPPGGPSWGCHRPGHYQAPGLDEIALGRALCGEDFSARALGLPHSQVPSSVRVDVKPQTLACALRAPRCFICTMNRSVPVEVWHENHEPLGHCQIHSGRVPVSGTPEDTWGLTVCRPCAGSRTPGLDSLVHVRGGKARPPGMPPARVCWCSSPGSGCEILENLYVVPENSY